MRLFKQWVLAVCLLLGSYVATAQSPGFIIDDVSLLEGDSGNTLQNFTISIQNYDGGTYSVDLQTADSTAQAGQDYQSVSTTLNFFCPSPCSPSATAQTSVAITVFGDNDVENDEEFQVLLSNPTNGAQILDGTGVGTIRNDDAPPSTPTPTATPSPTPVATATPSPTPIATATPSPTPVATATPSPTPVATATPSPTPVATATPSPTPVSQVSPLQASVFLDVQPAITKLGQRQNWELQVDTESSSIENYHLDLQILSGPGELVGDAPSVCEQQERIWSCRWSQAGLSQTILFGINTDRAGDTAVQAKLSSDTAEKNLVLYSQTLDQELQAVTQTIPGNSQVAVQSVNSQQIYRVGDDGLQLLDWIDGNFTAVTLNAGYFDRLSVLMDNNIVVSGDDLLLFDQLGQPVTAGLDTVGSLIVAADLWGDSQEELLISTEDGLLLHNLSESRSQVIAVDDLINALVADVNRDALADLVLITRTGFQVWFQATNAEFIPQGWQADSPIGPAQYLDINQDGQAELLLAVAPGNVNVWQLNSVPYQRLLGINSAPVIEFIDSTLGLWLFTQNGVHSLLAKPITQAEPRIVASLVSENVQQVSFEESQGQTLLLLSRSDSGLDLVLLTEELQTQEYNPQPKSSIGGLAWPCLLLLSAVLLRRRITKQGVINLSFLVLFAPSFEVYSQPTLTLMNDSDTALSEFNIALDQSSAELAVILDGIDVSQWLSGNGRRWILSLPTRLQAGTHQLQLFTTADVETSNLVTEWNFDVPDDPRVRWSYGMSASVSGVHRLDADEPEFYPPETRGEGSLNSSAQWQYRQARLAQVTDVLWNSEGADPFELSNSQIQADYGPLGIRAGDIQFIETAKGRVVDNQQRRGVMAFWQSERLSSTGFVGRPTPLQGFQHGFGVSDGRQRSRGLIIDAVPVQADNGQLSVNFSGHRTTSLLDPIEPASEADNQAVSFNSQLILGAYQLDSNVAVTQTDFPQFTGESDNAYRVSLQRQSLQRPLWGKEFFWSANLEHARSGSYFGSLLNPSDSVDLRLNRWNAYLQWGRIGLNLDAQDSRDNVNGLPIGRVRNRYYVTAMNWLPPAQAAWYGSPSAQVQVTRQNSHQQIPSPDPQVPQIDQDYLEWQLNFVMDWPGLSLSVLNRNGKNQDRSAQINEIQREFQIQLSSNGWEIGNRIQLQPRISWIQNRFEERNNNQQTLAAGFSLFANLPWDTRAILNAQYEETHLETSGNDSRLWQLNPSLEWQTALPFDSQLQLSLNANYNAFRQSGVNDETWVALLRMTLYWPWEYNNATP